MIVALHKLILRIFFGTVIVSKDEIGIVNKKWVLFGKNRELPGGAIIALNGELVCRQTPSPQESILDSGLGNMRSPWTIL